jgi:hypothetical protein
MKSEILDLLTSVATAKARGEMTIHIIENWARDHDVDLNVLGRRARRSFSNRLEAAAVSMAQTIARAANVISEAPSAKELEDLDAKWQND